MSDAYPVLLGVGEREITCYAGGMTCTVSILVVAFNEAAALPKQAAALRALELPGDLAMEWILVDGGSSDGTAALAQSLGYRVLVRSGANIPLCRNLAIHEARGDVLAFLDADCAPASDWLREALPFLESGEAVMVGWPVRPPLPGTWVQRAWHAHWLHKHHRTDTRLGRDCVLSESFRLMTTRNMLMTRAVPELLQGFDEKLSTGEDTDFALRAYQRKVQVIGLSSLHVVHHGEPETLRAFFRQQLWHANRRSYRKILAESGGRTGGNAPLFTLLFLGSALAAGAGVLLFPFSPASALLCLPLPGLLGLLAARTTFKARRIGLLPALFVLYGAYGLARSLDLLGLSREKKSWKRGGRR